jgi:hypothetical protein
LFPKHFQSFLALNTLYSFVVDQPTFISQKRCHSVIPKATKFTGQLDDPLPEQFLIIWHLFVVSLGRAWLADHLTGSAF